jgi:subtilisin family serine protease
MFGNYMITTAQVMSKIDDQLQQEMAQHEKSENLRINIILNEQYDQTEMQNKVQFINNKEEKRSFVVNELKNFSQETQKNLIMFLSGMEARSSVSDIQSLWIVNMITCYASIETIETLSLHPDVLIIGWDNEQYMLPEEWWPAPAEPTREITYNITKVQANNVWTLGYTGQNVVVAIVDSGVNYNHNDLAGNMWTHPNYPYHGWNFVSNNNNPMDDDGHGTHCAGTVAGQGASGSQTGIAPNAKIMAIKAWPASGASTKCAGIQFAADNGAHVISMSLGVIKAKEAEKIQFRTTMINVLNMGIIATIAAGNEGPNGDNPINPPNSIKAPGNCPPPWLHPDQTTTGGTSAVVCVGATDNNDNIADFSSIGPVTWQNIAGYNDYPYNPGMGLIRPDVVAPGVYIKSLLHTNNSGYDIMSGTSMATPCVAGVIALMLSKNPELTPAEICEILETTAVRLPNSSSPKNNIYGSGRINALAAVNAVPCYMGSLISKKTITQDTTWNTIVHAIDTITIQSGATLTITSRVNCENNTTIIVQPNGKLVIDGGTLTATCSDSILWQGIVVLGNDNQPQLPQHQGTVELKNGAIIEHALCAISAAPASYDSPFIGIRGGGIIQADSAIFRDNLQAVEYRPYEYKPLIGDIADNVGKFTNCTFTISNIDRFTANGKYFRNHVTMWGVRGVTFEGCTFENTIGVLQRIPVITEHGISTLDAGFKVINYCKPGGSTGIDCPCRPTHTKSTVFKNLDVGVRSDNTGISRSVYMDQSNFYSLGTGVRMNEQTNYRLTRCDFINDNIGLYSNNSSGYKIEENNFSIIGNSAGSVTGIYMNNSGNVENRIYKNYFSNFTKGISVDGINGPKPNELLQIGLQFISNEFENNRYDIHISSDATVRPYQGNSSVGACNKFVETDTSSFYSQNPLTAQAITYYHSFGSSYIPYNPTSNITVIGTARLCLSTSTLCSVSPRSGIDSLEQYKMMQKQYDKLVAQLKENPENPELLQEILILSDAMRELSDHAISRILQDSILYLDALKSWYEVVRTPIAKYWLAETYFSEKKYEQAEVILQEIPIMFGFKESEMTEHENYMQFYNFKKKMYLSERNWSQLDEAEIAQLQTIAESTDGRSAGMAKGVLCFFYDICYEDKIEEGEDTKRGNSPPLEGSGEATKLETRNLKLETLNSKYELSIYPNPTSGELIIDNGQLKIENVAIYDMMGQSVCSFTRPLVHSSTTTIDISNLPSGVYFVKVVTDKGDTVIRKVVKQ